MQKSHELKSECEIIDDRYHKIFQIRFFQSQLFFDDKNESSTFNRNEQNIVILTWTKIQKLNLMKL